MQLHFEYTPFRFLALCFLLSVPELLYLSTPGHQRVMWGVTSPWPTHMQPGVVNPVRTIRGTGLSLCARPSFSHCTRCSRFRQASASGHSGPGSDMAR